LKKYKIAFVVYQFPSVSQTFILNQITDMIERGHEVKIYSFKKKKENLIHHAVERYKLLEKTTHFTYPRYSGLKKAGWLLLFTLSNFNALIHEPSFTFAKPGSIRRAIRNLSLSQSIAAFLHTNAFDIVHAHFGQRAAWIANVMAKGLQCKFKFVVTFHGIDLNPCKIDRYKIAYRNLFLHANAITVNTIYLRSILLKVRSDLTKVFVLPVGLRTDQYRKRPMASGLGENLFTIIYCGRFIELKGPDLAVRIVNTLVHERGFKNIRLRMIGSGELGMDVENLINEFKLEEHVSLLGPRSQEDVIEEMNKAHLFLLPGIHEKETGRAETQGLVIQEAQAMELPVVVSDAGGMKYGLLEGVSGFVVKEGDIEGFADKIELLINNEPMRAAMAKAGRDFVVQSFDTKILGDKLAKIYAEI
jgi:colanic acid/amylovoran biosynthesis glycosyltransferase